MSAKSKLPIRAATSWADEVSENAKRGSRTASKSKPASKTATKSASKNSILRITNGRSISSISSSSSSSKNTKNSISSISSRSTRGSSGSSRGSSNSRLPPRVRMFNTCVKDQHDARVSAGLDGISMHDKMTDAEVFGLRDYFGGDVRRLLSYEGMQDASHVLCRWPRPSELARVIAASGQGSMTYRSFKVVFEAKAPLHSIIGPVGKHLNDLTKNNDLLYAWIKRRKEEGKAELFLYAIDSPGTPSSAKVFNAAAAFFGSGKAVQFGKPAMSTRKLTPKSKDWGGEKA